MFTATEDEEDVQVTHLPRAEDSATWKAAQIASEERPQEDKLDH